MLGRQPAASLQLAELWPRPLRAAGHCFTLSHLSFSSAKLRRTVSSSFAARLNNSGFMCEAQGLVHSRCSI